jgi:hypothetical protein
MTKEEFIIYTQAILDTELVKGGLTGSLKLLKEALDKVDQTQPQPSPFYPMSPNLNPPFVPGIISPYTGGNPLDWTYRPEHQPYYTITCTTNTTQQK